MLRDIERYLERCALDEAESLAEHDSKYHPRGYKEGDHCNRREKGDKADSSLVSPVYQAPHVKITPAEDSAYMDAVKRGDMETCSKMVRNAAAKAMPDTKIVDKDGFPMIVYHGTPNNFTKFERQTTGASQFDIDGFYFGREGSYGFQGNKVMPFFINVKNPAHSWKKQVGMTADGKHRRFLSVFGNENTDRPYRKSEGREKLIAEGFDGAYRGGNGEVTDAIEFIALFPRQIKSSDPVTYDDNGTPIQLSRRFDFTSEDFRY